jgi:hypothetical protein
MDYKFSDARRFLPETNSQIYHFWVYNSKYMTNSRAKIAKIRNNALTLLGEVGLDRVVSAQEIEEELSGTEHLYDSPLLLGIITRCSENSESELLLRLIPLITDWKNYIPRPELGGLSPREYEQRHPRGPAEVWIINKLLQTYEIDLQSRLNIFKPADFAKDFATYQSNFFELIPAIQPFPEKSITLNHREIIVEERRQKGHPEDMIDKFGTIMFAHEPSENAQKIIRQIEALYANSADIIASMRPNAKPSAKKLGKVLSDLASIEPFMKCMSFAPAYYGTFAGAALLLKEYSLAEDLLRQSLVINPHFRPARRMLRLISSVREKPNK